MGNPKGCHVVSNGESFNLNKHIGCWKPLSSMNFHTWKIYVISYIEYNIHITVHIYDYMYTYIYIYLRQIDRCLKSNQRTPVVWSSQKDALCAEFFRRIWYVKYNPSKSDKCFSGVILFLFFDKMTQTSQMFLVPRNDISNESPHSNEICFLVRPLKQQQQRRRWHSRFTIFGGQ